MEPFLIFAFAAMLCWGVGDFLIQRTARKTSSLETLTFIGIIGILVLLPFIIPDLLALDTRGFWILTFLGVVTLIAAILQMESLRAGKLSVMEVLLILELPLTVAFGLVVFGEILSPLQLALIIAIMVGVVLISFERGSMKGFTLEKGVLFAVLGAIGMAFVNYLTAEGARTVSPLMAVWFPYLVFTVICVIVIVAERRVQHVRDDVARNPWLIVAVGVVDTLAWVFYAYATSHGELAITTAITESYPVIAIALAVTFNKEWLAWHQWLGAALALGASVALAVV